MPLPPSLAHSAPLALSTLSGIVLAVLGFLLLLILFRLLKGAGKKSPSSAAPPSPSDIIDATIRDARPGDIVSVTGFGDEYDDVDFVIERRNRYSSGGFEWFELLGVYKGRQIWIEWEEDDALRITATSPEREIRLASLGIGEEDLARMDEEESRENVLEWEGERYRYAESAEVFFHKDCAGPGEGFYMWDFESEDGRSVISVEKWEGEPFQVFSGRVIPPRDVKVFKR